MSNQVIPAVGQKGCPLLYSAPMTNKISGRFEGMFIAPCVKEGCEMWVKVKDGDKEFSTCTFKR